MEEVGYEMPGAVPGQGSHLRAKAFLGFHIEPTMVSGLREERSAPVWVPPPCLSGPMCCYASSGGYGLAGTRRLSGAWLCRWSWVLWGR